MLSTSDSAPARKGALAPAAPQPAPTETLRAGTPHAPSDAAPRAPDALDALLARAVSERAVAAHGSAPLLQRAMMTQYEFIGTGGPASGKLGSSYSKIHALLAAISNSPLEVAEASYLNKPKRKATRELYEKLSRFHVNDEFKEGMAGKAAQIATVRRLKTEMEAEQLLDRARVSELLDKMAASSTPLIRNSGVGWAARLGAGTPRMSMLFSDAESRSNAQWGGTLLKIFNKNFWRSENLAIGLLVHEYHHLLVSPRSPKLYPNEFIAHWKQYQAMGKPLDAAMINTFLLGPEGYNMRNDAGKFAGTEFAGPEDAGALWTDFQYNKAPV